MIPAQVDIHVCLETVDMRYGFDRLMRMVRTRTGRRPEEGGLYVFANRKLTRLKVLWFEANGACVLYKRLHRAKFVLPIGNRASVRIDGQRLAQLLAGTPNQRHQGRRSPRRCEPDVPAIAQSA